MQAGSASKGFWRVRYTVLGIMLTAWLFSFLDRMVMGIALPAAPGPFELLPDEAYNLQHRDFDLVSRNAGPFFLLGEQIIHPTQVSTTVDYGVYLQFLARRGSSEVPLCAATPQNVEITGLAPADIIGIHTYCRDDVLEIIDARYLTRLPKIETAVETVSEAKP